MDARVLGMTVVLLLATLPVSAHGESSTPQLLVDWQGEGEGQQYLLLMHDDAAYDLDIVLQIQRGNESLTPQVNHSWATVDGRSTATLVADVAPMWGDLVHLQVTVVARNGEATTGPVLDRSFSVGRWNEPMADHELTTTSSWTLEQRRSSADGPQTFVLDFNGQGWQQRVGERLDAWDLGDGSLQMLETLDGSTMDLNLTLDRVWRNQTSLAGVVTSTVFDATGYGTLVLLDTSGGLRSVVTTTVSEASLNRSVVLGVVDERLRLEANGTIAVNEEDASEAGGQYDLDGTVSVLLLELWDENGTRRLDHQQVEAQATLVLIEDGTRMDLDLDAFTSLQRWEDGVRIDQHEVLKGEGTFGFEDQDENATMIVNGTVHRFHQESLNGITTEDTLHVDGTLSGDVQGTFGVVRGIEATTTTMNASGVTFDVNVIHQEDWFNITGMGGGSFLGGAGLGSHHNESWSYDVIGIDYDNRTVRLIWEQTGPDPSEGDERPARSPVPVEPQAPEPVEGLGDVDVGRETGLVPIPMWAGDRVLLDGQEGLTMHMDVLESSTDSADGRTFTTVRWSGSYLDLEGTAEGHLVSAGPLSGLSTTVLRSVEVPYGGSGDVAWLNETQHLDRVLSPSVVTEEDNTLPHLLSLSTPAGSAVAEGGRSAVLVAEVEDPDWNLRDVVVDLGALGLGLRALNDKGVDGDTTVGDDRWSTVLSITSGAVGSFTVPVLLTDAFGEVTDTSWNISIENPGPRATGLDLVPDRAERGSTVIVEVTVVDQHDVEAVRLDLTPLGGSVVTMERVSGTDRWGTDFAIPESATPGTVLLSLEMTDGLGATRISSVTFDPLRGLVGPFDGEGAAEPVPFVLTVVNDAPSIAVPDRLVLNSADRGRCVPYEVEVVDLDGVRTVQVDRGSLTPLGSSAGWFDMVDDGTGDDRVAGDGVWTTCVEVRSGTPLGAHEILLRASDDFGAVSPTASAVVSLEEGGEPTQPGGGGSMAMAWLGLGVGGLVLLGAVMVMLRRGPGSFEEAFGER